MGDVHQLSPNPERIPPGVSPKQWAEREQLGRSWAAGLLTVEELEELIYPPDLIPGLLPADALGVLFGKPGSAKSFTALDFACCLTLGLPWQGREVREGPALYVITEGVKGFGRRLRAWKQAVAGVPDLPIPDLHFRGGAQDLLNPESRPVREVAHGAKALGARLVVVDTLARSILGADENSARDMGQLVASATYIREVSEATVLLVHHTTKDGGDYRGNSALEGAADVMLHQTKEDDGHVTLKCYKQKDEAKFEDIHLRLEVVSDVKMPGDRITSSCVLRSYHGVVGVPGVSEEKQRTALEALHTFHGSSGGASSSKWLATSGMKDQTFYRAREALVRRGFVENTGTEKQTFYRLTGKGLQALQGELLP